MRKGAQKNLLFLSQENQVGMYEAICVRWDLRGKGRTSDHKSNKQILQRQAVKSQNGPSRPK